MELKVVDKKYIEVEQVYLIDKSSQLIIPLNALSNYTAGVYKNVNNNHLILAHKGSVVTYNLPNQKILAALHKDNILGIITPSDNELLLTKEEVVERNERLAAKANAPRILV